MVAEHLDVAVALPLAAVAVLSARVHAFLGRRRRIAVATARCGREVCQVACEGDVGERQRVRCRGVACGWGVRGSSVASRGEAGRVSNAEGGVGPGGGMDVVPELGHVIDIGESVVD